LAALEQKHVPDYAAVLTIDDGYRSVYDNAVPLLRRHKVPATVYLITGVLDSPTFAWPNAFAWLFNRHGTATRPVVASAYGIPPDLPAELIIDHVRQHYNMQQVSDLLETLWRCVGEDPEQVVSTTKPYLTWSEAAELQGCGLTLGSHTVNHPNLACLSIEDQRSEISRAKQRIEEEDHECTSLAYPFGDHEAATRRLAVECGYHTVMEVGLRAGPLDATGIGRIPVMASDAAGLFTEIELVAPLKARIKKLLATMRGSRKRGA
jgi:peptidoglycan/xylan/chitin deacetylase (PgdA/CDA1 family)